MRKQLVDTRPFISWVGRGYVIHLVFLLELFSHCSCCITQNCWFPNPVPRPTHSFSLLSVNCTTRLVGRTVYSHLVNSHFVNSHFINFTLSTSHCQFPLCQLFTLSTPTSSTLTKCEVDKVGIDKVGIYTQTCMR